MGEGWSRMFILPSVYVRSFHTQPRPNQLPGSLSRSSGRRMMPPICPWALSRGTFPECAWQCLQLSSGFSLLPQNALLYCFTTALDALFAAVTQALPLETLNQLPHLVLFSLCFQPHLFLSSARWIWPHRLRMTTVPEIPLPRPPLFLFP